jgi:NAD(P)-dependent dehydrogenase (short-subunit alcohol dehydrogenase family)
MHSLPDGYTALVIGASGTIGRAFCNAIAADPACASVFELSRSTHSGFDLGDPGQLADSLSTLLAGQPLSLVIDATGVLSADSTGPEKSLAAVRHENLHRLMQINAVGPLMLLRELAPRLARGRCLYGKLSARVGSIADNRLGGWYSYRASKAALNMLLQTAAIELQRRLPGLVVAAMQPGTVRSPLSQRFVSAVTETVSPEDAARGLLAALDAIEPGPGARFVDYRGLTIPW